MFKLLNFPDNNDILLAETLQIDNHNTAIQLKTFFKNEINYFQVLSNQNFLFKDGSFNKEFGRFILFKPYSL